MFTEALYPDQLPFSVSVMAPVEVVAEKVRAILTRNKARDVYDAWFLTTKGTEVDIELVDRKLEYYNMKFDRKDLQGKLEEIGDMWKPELSPIIFGPLPEYEDVKKSIMALL